MHFNDPQLPGAIFTCIHDTGVRVETVLQLTSFFDAMHVSDFSATVLVSEETWVAFFRRHGIFSRLKRPDTSVKYTTTFH